MKKYNTEFIKKYITEHKSEIERVKCGMREDWSWTSETVWEDGEFCKGFDWSKKHISIGGISGSTWATPVMWIELKDGSDKIIPCFEDDGEEVPIEQIKKQKMFASLTFGADYKF